MFQVFFRRNRKKNVFFENTIRQRYSFVLNRCKLRYFIKHAQKHKGDKFHECRRLSFLDIYTKRMNPGGFASTSGFAPICFKCNRGSGFSVCSVYFFIVYCCSDSYFNRFIFTDFVNQVEQIKQNNVEWGHGDNLLSPSLKWIGLVLCRLVSCILHIVLSFHCRSRS